MEPVDIHDLAKAHILHRFQGDVLNAALEAGRVPGEFVLSVISRVGPSTVLVPHARFTVDPDGEIDHYERLTDEWAIGDHRIRSWLAPQKAHLARLAADPPPPPL